MQPANLCPQCASIALACQNDVAVKAAITPLAGERQHLRLITKHPGVYHVSLDTVKEFEAAILHDPFVVNADAFGEVISKASAYAWSLEERFGLPVHVASRSLTDRFVKAQHYFSVLMGPNFRKCLPHFALPGHKSLYMFDAWPQSHRRIARFLDLFRVEHAFFSSRQVANTMQVLVATTHCHWIPEGIDPSVYVQRPPDERDIDVLALGRKYDAHHLAVIEPLMAAATNYRYETVKSKIVFPTRQEFIEGLSRSKISICVPSSVTHPERSGNVQTMTVRYLQSMASKCLVVGHAPEEMITLFGYNPVIEIDMGAPAEQLLLLLRNYSQYSDLIERNYAAVTSRHSWSARWLEISKLIYNA